MLNTTLKDTSSLDIQEDQIHDDIELLDFSKSSKAELAKMLQNITSLDNPVKTGVLLKKIKSQFDHLTEIEKGEALEKFIADGGIGDDFEFKKDAEYIKFEKLYEQWKQKTSAALANQEKERESNLAAKKHILEMLRVLISKEETNESIVSLKDYQEQWRKIGQVPQAAHQELWQSYNALIDRFYNNRSIYFELKELDRKKNYESKVEICDKAEKLLEHHDIGIAVRELKNLHDEYKMIGPVPKEQQEELWQRFKEISDKLYNKRTEHLQEILNKQVEALAKKELIITKIEEFKNFHSDRIDDWKNKTNELTSLQEEWKNTGNVPLESSKDINKRFWAACKAYFSEKEKFFSTLEEKRKRNLEIKTDLCVKVEKLIDSTDLGKATQEAKELQKQWDKIGGVPIKQKETINTRFKNACDKIFQLKRDLISAQEKEYENNYLSKLNICNQIIEKSTAGTLTELELKGLQNEFKNIGFVPKEKIKDVQEKFNQAIQAFIKQLGGDESNESHKHLKLSLEIASIKEGPDAEKRIQRKEQDIQRKISGLKSEIAQYSNNMEFFGRSANADKLKQEIQKKIDQVTVELKKLEQELKIIKQA